MRTSIVTGLELLATALIFAACGSRPIPLSVVPGTTFILPGIPPVFGNQVSKDKGVQDYQRGDLVVALCPTSNASCTPTTQTHPCLATPEGIYLTTHWVTEVMPSPASNIGLAGRIDNPATASVEILGEELAFLDVPASTCPGEYSMSVRTRPAGQSGPEGIYGPVWDLIVSSAPAGMPNPNETTVGGGHDTPPNPFGLTIDVEQNMADLVPNPTAHLRLSDPGFYSTYPAAAEIDVTYPSSLVQILGAYQYGHLGLRSMLNWSDNGTGTVHLALVDPTRCTEDINIVFKLKTSTAVSTTTDFTIPANGQRRYDLNGNLLTQNPYIVAAPYTTAPLCGA
jgi:hypothetical protein